MLTILSFGDLWMTIGHWSVLAFYNNWTVKIKIKHRYNYTDSGLINIFTKSR